MNLNKGQNINICSSYWELFCRKGVIFCLVSILWTLVDFFWTKRLFSQGTLFFPGHLLKIRTVLFSQEFRCSGARC